MALIRNRDAKPTENFSVIPNALIRDTRLSWTERGLLIELLSHQDGFEVNLSLMCSGRGFGKAGFYKALDHLEELGYLSRDKQERTEKGSFGQPVYTLHTVVSQKHHGTVSSEKNLGDRGISAGVRQTDYGEKPPKKTKSKNIKKKNTLVSSSSSSNQGVKKKPPRRLQKSVDVSLTDEDGNYVSKRDRGITPDPSVSYRRRVGVLPAMKKSPRQLREASSIPSVDQTEFDYLNDI